MRPAGDWRRQKTWQGTLKQTSEVPTGASLVFVCTFIQEFSVLGCQTDLSMCPIRFVGCTLRLITRVTGNNQRKEVAIGGVSVGDSG